MNKQYIIQLSDREHQYLESIIRKGTHKSRMIQRARVLLASNTGHTDKDIARTVGISKPTAQRIRRRYHEEGMESALSEKPRSGAPPKLTNRTEAYLVATACSAPPDGATHWSLELLREQLIKARKIKTISTVAIWHHLNNRGIKPWREKNVGDPNAHSRVR